MSRAVNVGMVVWLAVMSPASAPVALAQAPPSASAEAYYEFLRARSLEGEGEIDEAIRAYERAAALDPKSAEVRAELAGLYARQNRPKEAVAAAEGALRVDPDNGEAHWVLGTVLAAQVRGREGEATAGAREELARAVDHLEKARAARPYDVSLVLTLGRLYLRQPAYDRAVATLEALRQQEPGLPEAGWLLAQAYQGQGRRAEAIRVLDETLAVQPDFYRGLLLLADLYEQERQWKRAAETYALAAEQNPRFAELRLRQASALLNANEPAAAREVLRDAVRQSPTDGALLFMLSEAEREAGDLAGAESAARRLVALEPNQLRGALALAQVFEERHESRQVVATLEPVAAQKAAPGPGQPTRQFATVLAHLGFAYQELGEHARAVASFERARAISPADAGLDVYVAQAYLAAGQPDRAISLAAAVRAARPDDLRPVRIEAQALVKAGRAADAARLLETWVGRSPGELDGHLTWAQVLADATRVDEALRVLDGADARFEHPVLVAFQRGAILEQAKRVDDAERALREAIRRDPAHGPSLNYLGYLFADRGERLDEAIGLIERALATDPHNPSYLDSLGWAWFKRGDLDKARPPLARAADLLPVNSVVQDHHGDLLWALRDAAGAIAAWERALAGDGESIDRDRIKAKIADARRAAR